MNWKHLVCLWLEEQGYSYNQEQKSPIHVLSLNHNQLFDIYITNFHQIDWFVDFSNKPDKGADIYVFDSKSRGTIRRTGRTGSNRLQASRPVEHPDSWRYHVGGINDPRFFTRLKLGMNKMRERDDRSR